MKILVVNAGSSSLKFQLFHAETETVLLKGSYDGIGLSGKDTPCQRKLTSPEGTDRSYCEIKDHEGAIADMLEVFCTGVL
jgi:acetate kinase